MKITKVMVGVFLSAACVALFSCGGGHHSSPPTFDLTVEPPGGSGLASAQAGGFTFVPAVSRSFTLSTGVLVNGQVTDGVGAPLAGVDVSFRTSAGAPESDGATTDIGGNYQVRVTAGTYVAVVDSNVGSLGSITVTGIPVVAPGPVNGVDLQFASPVSISGTVFEFDLLTAIPGAQIDATGTGTGASASVVADGFGDYNVSLVPDIYTVVVTPAAPSDATHLKETFSGQVVTVAMVGADFVLTRGVQVSGTVFDNLSVFLDEFTDIEAILPANSPYFPPADVTTSDIDGTYTIGPVPIGTVTFDVEAPGDTGFPTQRFVRQIVGPTVETEDFTLALGFVLTGIILRDTGLPEEDVEVKPVPTNGSLAPDDDDTDIAGVFEISLFAGTYDVQITPTTANLQLPEVVTITVIGPPLPLFVTLTLGTILDGTVFEPDGFTFAPDVRVQIPNVLGASDVTDGLGDYSFLAPIATHTLTVADEGGNFEDIALDPVPGVVVGLISPVTEDITLSVAVSGGTTVVQGTVLDLGGTPVNLAEITARGSSGDKIGRAFTDALGAYTLVIP